MPTPEEVAWAAGLFEGEGCFSSHAGNAYRPVANMAMTDLDILERFRDVLRIGRISSRPRPLRPNCKLTWEWWSNEEEFHILYALIKPWLGPRRIAAAENAIRKRKEHIEKVTAERQCACCKRKFRPEFKVSGFPSKYCSAVCKQYRATHSKQRQANLRLRAWNQFGISN